MSNDKQFKCEFDWNFLQRVADYYEFPVAVFFSPEKAFPEKQTRIGNLGKKAECLDKIKEIIEEMNI